MKFCQCEVLVGIFLTLLTAGCKPAPSGSFLTCRAGTYDEEIVSGGLRREYRLHVPAMYQPGKPVPMVFGFHCAGSTAGQFEQYSGFSALADREGFIAVYPQGLGQLTNWDTMPRSQDVQLVRDLIDNLEARCSIDPARIYATGHSRGGGMANRLGCELADRLAAIGPVSGDYEYSDDCSPSRPVAVVAFHGTMDPAIPYNGFGIPGQMHESYLRIGTPIPTWASTWAERDGCSAKPSIVFQEGQVSGQEWGACQAGSDVILYTVNGGTHAWPGEVDAARMIWNFFALHPLVSVTSP